MYENKLAYNFVLQYNNLDCLMNQDGRKDAGIAVQNVKVDNCKRKY